MKQIRKGVKITATKENIPYILPTLITLGGINHYHLITYENDKQEGINEGEVYYINNDGNIDYTIKSGDFPTILNHYEELDLSEYISADDKTTINKSLSEKWKECKENIDDYVTEILLHKNQIREIESFIEILYVKIQKENKTLGHLQQELENQSNK
jgi:hypothetical protein